MEMFSPSLMAIRQLKKAGIQLIYGMEANIVEDRVPITYNEVDLDLS